MVVAQTLVTMDDCHVHLEQHDGHVVTYTLTETADRHANVSDVDLATTAQCGNGYGF